MKPDPGFWRGRRVLLTGHTGFKGAWLALWLSELGAEVHGFSTPPPTNPSLFAAARVNDAIASSAIGDVRDAAAVRAAVRAADPEVVLHLAAQAIVRTSFAAPAETFAVNVVGTAHLLEAVASDSQAKTVVVVTSDKCYRDVHTGRAMREDDPLGGKDPYSASKAAQELVTSAMRDTLLAERGVAISTARAGNVIGGGDWAPHRLVPDLFRAAVAGEPLEIRNPAAVRPWQHVLNPLSGYLRLAESGVAEAFNFGPPRQDEQPVAWIVDRLREQWPEPISVREQVDPDAGKEAAVLRLDSTKARERLGWEPGWDLAAGLDATVGWHIALGRGDDARALTQRQIKAFARA